MDPTRSEFVLQPVQRQVRRLADPFQNEGSMPLEHSLAVSTHLARRHRTGPAIPLRRRNDTFTQIIGKRSGHQMLASTPASILNYKLQSSGIHADSINQ
jgi:hypothetical protein